jgi:inhibitor of KinA
VSLNVIPAGDSAIVIEFEERIAPDVNARAVRLADALTREGIPGVRDAVPTYRSVAVYFDPLRVDYERLRNYLDAVDHEAEVAAESSSEAIRLPVCYGGDLGPDLGEVAAFAGITEQQVIKLHAGGSYRVYMLGFVPGFAYMCPVDSRIAMPRRPTPRVRVPLGSVGIGGIQTGVYPAETPGGWRLIGRTPIKPFDPVRAKPFLMKAGDTVQFYAIDRAEYDAWPSS